MPHNTYENATKSMLKALPKINLDQKHIRDRSLFVTPKAFKKDENNENKIIPF